MADLKLEVINGGSALDGRAYLHKESMDALGLDDFDVIQLINEYEDFGACQVIGNSEQCAPGFVMVDSSILDSANISEGDIVTVRKAKAKGNITQVQIGVQSMAQQPTEETVVWVAEHAGELANILKKRPIYRNLEIDWRDAGCGHVKLRIMKAKGLEGDEIGIIDPTGHEILFEICPALEMSFNAILLLDVSGSMQKQDLVVRDSTGILEGLKKGLKDSDDLNKFLVSVEEGGKVSRIHGAALSTLLYLSLKIGRGWGEYVQILTFADNVETLKVSDASGNQTEILQCTGALKEANLNAMAQYVISKTDKASGLTAMSVALKKAVEQIDKFPTNPKTGKRNPTMIVLLTDGQPNKGDSDAVPEIPVNPIPIVKKEVASKEGVALYAIGIGEADDKLMEKIAEYGRGEYFKANSFGELWKFYDTLAQRFAIAAKTTPESFQEFVEENEPQGSGA